MMFKIPRMRLKGSAAIWLQALITILIVGLCYIVFSDVLWGNIAPLVYPNIQAINASSSAINTTQLTTTLNIINMVWMVFPLIFILGVIFWAFVASQRREAMSNWI